MLQDYYILLYNATALWLTIGLIWVVMGCYGRKSKFADVGILRDEMRAAGKVKSKKMTKKLEIQQRR